MASAPAVVERSASFSRRRCTVSELCCQEYGDELRAAAEAQQWEQVERFLLEGKHPAVNLSSLGLKDPIAKMIARAMRENRNLRSFSLWENDFTSEGMRAIAEALKASDSVEELWLGSNMMDSAAVVMLAEAVRDNKSLVRLGLNYNSAGDEGATAIAKALQGNRTLRFLYLRRNGIKDTGAEALLSLLQGKDCALRELDLSCNPIGPELSEKLRQAIGARRESLREEGDRVCA